MLITADVPLDLPPEYYTHYKALSKGTDRFFVFAADHKIEHLDADFFGPGIAPEAHNPTHLFTIAQQAPIGALATHFGLIARYAHAYPGINYIVKLNGKTNIIPTTMKDPMSGQLWQVDDVMEFKRQSQIPILGIGLTVYLGSNYEDIMLAQAAESIYQAHQYGLLTLLWLYPRGKAVINEYSMHLLAGAVGVATSLGADIVKIHPPKVTDSLSVEEQLAFIVQAAGNTAVICAGGKQHDASILLGEIKEQLQSGCSGVAIGRNIYQQNLPDALKLSSDIAQLVYGTP